jgi:hypothetical protein
MRRRLLATALLLLSGGEVLYGGQAAPSPPASPPQEQGGNAAGEPQLLDRAMASINGAVLLDSDVEEELHFTALQPYLQRRGVSDRRQAFRRLLNRTLILQQIRQQDAKKYQPSDQEVRQRIEDLRKALPACARYRCQTAEGWQRFLKDNDFTEQEVWQYWKTRLETLNFIEARFRAGIHITEPEMREYYEKQLLPQYEKEKVAPPAFAGIQPRIEEILLQARVNMLLQDWLKSLRDQGDVTILDPEFKDTKAEEEEQ